MSSQNLKGFFLIRLCLLYLEVFSIYYVISIFQRFPFWSPDLFVCFVWKNWIQVWIRRILHFLLQKGKPLPGSCEKSAAHGAVVTDVLSLIKGAFPTMHFRIVRIQLQLNFTVIWYKIAVIFLICLKWEDNSKLIVMCYPNSSLFGYTMFFQGNQMTLFPRIQTGFTLTCPMWNFTGASKRWFFNAPKKNTRTATMSKK